MPGAGAGTGNVIAINSNHNQPATINEQQGWPDATPQGQQQGQTTNDPIQILVDDLLRTEQAVKFLTAFLANISNNNPQSLFTTQQAFSTTTAEQTHTQGTQGAGKPTNTGNKAPKPGSLAWQIHQTRNNQTTTKQMALAPHPALAVLQAQQSHLLKVANTLLIMGIKLAANELSDKQQAMLNNTLKQFAISLGLNPEAKNVKQAMLQATNQTPGTPTTNNNTQANGNT